MVCLMVSGPSCSNVLDIVWTNWLNNQANGRTQGIFNRKLSGVQALS